MADNTIIRVPQPRFGIREVVYFRESALLGYLEPAKVKETFYDPELGKTFYVFEYKKSKPNTQIAGDAIDLKSAKRISVVEEELLTYQEALAIKLNALNAELDKTQTQIDNSLGSPEIDVVEAEATVPLEFGDVAVGSSVTREYSVTNNGGINLVLTGSPAVSVLGDANDFLVTVQPISTIAPGDSATFTLRFAPVVVGRRVGVIQILSNDSTTSLLSFSVEGNGT